MRKLLSREMLKYVVTITITMVGIGLIIGPIVSDKILLVAVLSIAYVVFMLMLLYFYDRHIKPIRNTTHAVDQLVKGNYQARVETTVAGNLGELNENLNRLGRNLSELSIQERMQAEQLSTVIDNTESGLLLIDEKGYIHVANRKFVRMFGNTAKDYIGYLYYDVLANEEVHTIVQETFLYEKNIKGSFKHKRGTSSMYLEVVGAPIFNEKGFLKGTVLVIYDITELKKLEVMRKDFVANVSHELKTPITSIRGFAETLLEGSMYDKEELESFLKIIYEESNRLQVLTEDLLTLAKLEEDSFTLETSTVHISELVEDFLPIISHKAKIKDISLHADIDEHITFEADFSKVKQILINLLENALNYTPSGGEVSFAIHSDEEKVYVKVADTGIGMKEQDIDRIFERFYRVDQDRSRNTGGTGLGLAIVKHIVETHDGQIHVESELNKGTTFTVELHRTMDE
ncbi:MAG TPA: ATP-binding protein [Bacillota bacterium]|nr:ATP-binding protein [Bacillota bacterium]